MRFFLGSVILGGLLVWGHPSLAESESAGSSKSLAGPEHQGAASKDDDGEEGAGRTDPDAAEESGETDGAVGPRHPPPGRAFCPLPAGDDSEKKQTRKQGGKPQSGGQVGEPRPVGRQSGKSGKGATGTPHERGKPDEPAQTGTSGASGGRDGRENTRDGRPTQLRELGYEEDPNRKPFQKPRAVERLRHWSMSLDLGVAFPVPADGAPAKAGVSLTLRGGWRFLSTSNVGLYLGIQTSVVSFRKKETVVLNPDADPDQQVSCRDYREFNVWSLGAGVWLQAQRGPLIFGLGGSAGGAYVEQRQLRRRSADAQALTCGYDRASVWAPVVTAWAEVGWQFSPGVMVTVMGGFRGLFSDKRFTYQDAQGDMQDRSMVFHVPFVALSLVHRF